MAAGGVAYRQRELARPRRAGSGGGAVVLLPLNEPIAAPPFEAQRLEGEAIKLAQHEGRHIVVLDFWATWCGPCIRGLPVVSRVARRYRDRSVRFYAVNQGESPETIRRCLKDEGLDLNVLLDQAGKVGDQFFAETLPQTVIIGRDGTVQAVHVGYSAETEKKLDRELQQLVNGKQLILQR